MIYEWSPGFRYYGVSAQEAGEHLDKLSKTRPITPENVLEDARSPKSVLHPLFEWDDTQAAENYRRSQVRGILSNIKVTVTGGREEIATRAFVHIETDDNSRYEPFAKVLQNDALKAQMLQTAIEDMERFRKKYNELRELAGVLGAIETTIKIVRPKLHKMRKPARIPKVSPSGVKVANRRARRA